MQPLVIAQSSITPFKLPFIKPFSFAGNALSERVGFYLNLVSTSGLIAQGEVAPLPGLSQETLKKAEHDLKEICLYLPQQEIATDKDDLIKQLRTDAAIAALCPSTRFGVESALMSLAAQANGQTLAEFLGASTQEVGSAVLLQGTYDQVLADAKHFKVQGTTVFKLKVGDRNIPLDVKKVKDLRALIGHDGLLRLDGNRVWSLQEALLFAELAGNGQIEFIEEPLSDVSRINEFYQKTHMPIALDETLAVLRCGINAPGRCSPTLSQQEGVKAYVIKPMILGGIVTALDWIDEARRLGKKAIISSCFESKIGLHALAQLALLTGEVAGLGTSRWLGEDHEK